MTALPAAGYFTDASRTNAEAKQAQDDLRDVISQLLGGAAESTLTISAGSVTPPARDAGCHAIDTEASASTDDLTNISQTNTPDGRLLLIRAFDAGRTVVVKHAAGGAGQILLALDADFSLDDTDKWLLLKRTGTSWEEVTRSYGNDPSRQRTDLGLGTWAEKAANVLSKSAAYTVTAADDGKLILGDTTSAAWTLSLPPVATAGDGFRIEVENTGSAGNDFTLDPYSTELINDSATLALSDGQKAIVWCVGTAWRAIVVPAVGGGQIVDLIATATASGSSSIDFTGLSSTYFAYRLLFSGLLPATDNVELWLRMSTDNGATFKAGASDYASQFLHIAPTVTNNVYSNAAAQISLTDTGTAWALGTGVNEDAYGEILIHNPSAAGYPTQVEFVLRGYSANGTVRYHRGWGMYTADTAINAIRLLCSSGNIAAGDFRLYGLRASS